MNLLVFGIYEEREFARRKINEMISALHGDPDNTNYRKTNARDQRKAMYREMSKPEKIDMINAISEGQKGGIEPV